MIEKINSFYNKILGVRQTDKRIENVVILTPLGSMTSFGPLEYDTARIAKFLLNDIQAIRNKFKKDVEFFDHIDPKKLLVLLSVCELNFFSRADLVKFLEYKLNDFIRDPE